MMNLFSRIASLNSLARASNKPRTEAQVGLFSNGELKEIRAGTKPTSARGAVEEAQSQTDVFSLKEAMDREKNLIKDARERLRMNEPEDNRELGPAEDDLSAICLSGGGIRSAVFCLGGLMALDRANLIQQFDYLSTVSGGGYIGGWLSKLLKVLGDESVTASTSVFEAVRKKEEGMGAFKPASDAKTSDRSNFEPAALQFLRENSSYLTPQKSAFSGDTWSLAAIYLRNLFLNWAILLPFSAAVLATPLWILGGLGSLQDPVLVAHVTLLLALFSLVYPTIVPSLDDVVQDKGQRERSADRTDQERNARLMSLPSFLTLRLAPVAGTLFLFTHWVFIKTHQDSQNVSHKLSSGDIRSLDWIVGLGSGAPVVLLVLISMAVSIRQHGALGRIPSRLTFFTQTLGALCAVPSCAFLVPFLPGSGLWFYVWFPALATCTLLTAVTLFAGLVDPLVQDENREWWARSAGYFLLFSTGWLILGSVCVGLPYAPMGFVKFDPAACPGGVCISVDKISLFSAPGGLGFLVVLGTGIVAYLTRLEGQITLAARWFSISLGQVRKLVFAIAITVFSVAFAIASILLALKLAYLLNRLFVAGGHNQSESSHEVAWWWLLIAVLLLGGVSVLFSFPVNINRFSAHIAYRNRLVRTFLGASHLNRTYNPFTGFSKTDNVPLYLLMKQQLDEEEIRDEAAKDKPEPTSNPSQRPFHVICAAANVAQGDRLAWQERKAVSFTFSGLHCGGKEFGYRCSTKFGGPRGISLGTAMAVSGAAANSGMGFYSSPVKSFLLTLLNARLGWWFGNPMYKSACSRESPRFALGPLLIELFSLSRRNATWLNVSDGGHFDNTGVYEMLQRRCCRILLLDAETSRKGIANAARRARVDFNADLTLEKTAPAGCPVERYLITYHPADKEIESGAESGSGLVGDREQHISAPSYGTLIRVFPAIGEPSAWSSFENSYYKCINKTFPDDSLLNQFFTETLFESYRKLGFDTVHHVVKGKLDLLSGEAVEMRGHKYFGMDKLFGSRPKGIESSAPSPVCRAS
jgi:hypothetical protein